MNRRELYFPDFRLDSQSPPKNWQRIFDAKERKKYSRKTVIVEQGQAISHLYYIVSGMTEYSYTNESGARELIEVLGAGSLFGLQPIFGGNPAVGSLITLETSVISRMPGAELNTCLDRDPVLAKELLVELSKITGGLMRQLHESTFRADRRVEEVIYLLAEYKKRTTADEKPIKISISQDDLAGITRTTRVTVTKALGELRRQNLIRTAYGGIIVPDLDGLRENLDKCIELSRVAGRKPVD